MSEKKYYVFCASNCRYESMTKEQILAAITQAVESGEIHDVDTGFVTKLVEQNSKREVTLWVGTRAQYNAIAAPAENCLYIITDDTTAEDFDKAIAALQKQMQEFETKHANTDFSEAVTIPDVVGCGFEIESKKFVHDAASGIVHFCLNLRYTQDMVTGSFSAEIQCGSFKPKAAMLFPLTICGTMQNGGAQQISGSIGNMLPYAENRKIAVTNECEIKTGDRLQISGWYYV